MLVTFNILNKSYNSKSYAFPVNITALKLNSLILLAPFGG